MVKSIVMAAVRSHSVGFPGILYDFMLQFTGTPDEAGGRHGFPADSPPSSTNPASAKAQVKRA